MITAQQREITNVPEIHVHFAHLYSGIKDIILIDCVNTSFGPISQPYDRPKFVNYAFFKFF